MTKHDKIKALKSERESLRTTDPASNRDRIIAIGNEIMRLLETKIPDRLIGRKWR